MPYNPPSNRWTKDCTNGPNCPNLRGRGCSFFHPPADRRAANLAKKEENQSLSQTSRESYEKPKKHVLDPKQVAENMAIQLIQDPLQKATIEFRSQLGSKLKKNLLKEIYTISPQSASEMTMSTSTINPMIASLADDIATAQIKAMLASISSANNGQTSKLDSEELPSNNQSVCQPCNQLGLPTPIGDDD